MMRYNEMPPNMEFRYQILVVVMIAWLSMIQFCIYGFRVGIEVLMQFVLYKDVKSVCSLILYSVHTAEPGSNVLRCTGCTAGLRPGCTDRVDVHRRGGYQR
jgi:hypothetical protein